jgi:WD40 repeat protein
MNSSNFRVRRATLDDISQLAALFDTPKDVDQLRQLLVAHRRTSPRDPTLPVWDVETRAEVYAPPRGDIVLSLAFSQDGRRLASGSVDQFARVSDTASGKEISRLKHDRSVLSVAFSEDGRVRDRRPRQQV